MRVNMTKAQLYVRGGILDELMDKGFAAAGLVDAEGRLIRYSAPTLRDLGLTQKDCVGRLATDIDPDTHLAKVAQTGAPETGRLVLMRGKYHIINEFPIYDGDTLIGAMGLLTSLDTNKLKRVLQELPGEMDSKNITRLYDNLARASGSYTFNDYIGEHPSVLELLAQCRQAASTSYPVLITGETGTGKEILSGAIHSTAFPAGTAPYVKLNCTAIPDNLLESELFGHEKGAFTGAVSSKKGKFELANGGSILLDEIGEMDMRMQSKLLRVLEEKEFERLGGIRMLALDTRVIASTNADLPRLCAENRFRPDLYFRLSTIEIHVPPLRERKSDIPLLVKHFIDREGLETNFSNSAMEALSEYAWPGNIRQLRNIVMRLGISVNHLTVDGDKVRRALRQTETTISPPAYAPIPVSPAPVSTPSTADRMEEVEYRAILASLESTGYNQTEAARRLGIGRTTLYRKMRKYQIAVQK